MILHGDALTVLRTQFADESVQCCVTSPPYWGLRDYGTAAWERGDLACDHIAPPSGGKVKGATLAGTGNRNGFSADGQYRQSCAKCGAIRIDQQLGMEKTPEEYVSKMVEVFSEVRRVLKNDGTLWLNLGDTYSTGSGGTDPKSDKQRSNNGTQFEPRPAYDGLPTKNLVGIPWRVAFALQADGWYLRSDIIWSKPNPMPESVTDRPTKAHEYLFLLSKNERYYYDAAAIAEPMTYPERRYNPDTSEQKCSKIGTRLQGGLHDGREQYGNGETRNKRTVWTVATSPYAEAHFATFPPKLIEPCILAGAPVGGLVLDPFTGSGTTIMVAQQLGRQGVGIELNAEYIALAGRRCQQQGLSL